ncbi:MAG: hypothetical protein RL088_2636 [Verrucomicrobiota bacterium]|jgi:tape measure domain-containing protein
MSTAGIHYRLGLDAGPLVKGFAMARSAVDSFVSGAGKISGMVGALTGLAGAGGMLAAFGKAISGAAEMETTATKFETLIRSASGAKAALGELEVFANTTPFQFPELAEAGQKLLAFKGSAGELVGELRMLGDLSAGIGAPIGELAELYGKARVRGRLFGEDVNELAGRGIDVISEFAKQFGVTESAVRGLTEQGKIGFPELQKALRAMTSEGGAFFGMTEKLAQTTAGKWSTFSDAVQATMREFGKPVLGELKLLLDKGTSAVGGMAAKARELGKAFAVAVGTFAELMDNGRLFDAFGAGLKLAFATGVSALVDGLAAAVKGFAAALAEGIKAAFTGGDAGAAASQAFRSSISLFDPAKAKAEFLSIVGPAMDIVRARMAESGEIIGDAAAKFQFPVPQASLASAQLKELPKISRGGGDALARIGGYIGGGGPAAQKAANETARWTKAAAKTLEKIERKPVPKAGGSSF